MAIPKFSFNFLTAVPTVTATDVMKTAISTPSKPQPSKDILASATKALFPGWKESPVYKAGKARLEGKGLAKSALEFARAIPGALMRPVGKEEIMGAAMGATMPLEVKAVNVIENYAAKISTEFAPKAKTIGARLEDFYTSVVDRFNPIVNLARKAGGEIKAIDNPEILARNYLGIKSKTEVNLFKFTYNLDESGNVVKTGSSLADVLKPIAENLDDFRTFVTAQRDVELSQRGIRGVTEGGQESVNVIQALKQKYGEAFSAFENSATELRAYTDRVALKPLLDMGIMTPETYNAIKASNEFYVPFQRVLGELEETGFVGSAKNIFQPKVSPIKRIAGSEKQILDPLESIIANTYKITDFVERARVAKAIVNLRTFSEELGNLITKVKTRIVPVAVEEGKTIFRPDFFAPQKNTMMVFEDGKRVFYKVPEDVYKAVTNMTSSDITTMMKFLSYPLTFPTKLLRLGATTFSPEFIARNPLRDQFTAFIQSKFGFTPGVDLIHGLFDTLGKTELYSRWLAAGGDQSMFVSLDRLANQKTLAELIKNDSVMQKTLNIFKHPLDALGALSAFGEKATRLGEFRNAVKAGVSDLEAAFESREITLDFARIGQNTRAINQIVAFWNANIQDIDKVVRTFKARPVMTSVKAISGLTIPSISLWLLNKDNSRYQELPQWEKDMFWIIIPSDTSPIIRIPKPFLLGAVFATVPEHILQSVYKESPDQFSTAIADIYRVSVPSILPTAFLPVIENMTNYSFFRDRPILGQSIQGLPPEMQSLQYTAESAKLVGQFIKYSPAKIENIVNGYSGGAGKYILSVTDGLLKQFGIVNPPLEPEGTLADIPVLKAFIAREPIGTGSQSVMTFYDMLDKSRQAMNGLKELIKKGASSKEQTSFILSHKELTYNKGFEKAANAMTEIFKQRTAVLNNRVLNPKQKKAVIDGLDIALTELTNQMIELSKQSQ